MGGTATAGSGRPRPIRPPRSRIPRRRPAACAGRRGGRRPARRRGDAGGDVLRTGPARHAAGSGPDPHPDDDSPRPAAPAGATHGDGVRAEAGRARRRALSRRAQAHASDCNPDGGRHDLDWCRRGAGDPRGGRAARGLGPARVAGLVVGPGGRGRWCWPWPMRPTSSIWAASGATTTTTSTASWSSRSPCSSCGAGSPRSPGSRSSPRVASTPWWGWGLLAAILVVRAVAYERSFQWVETATLLPAIVGLTWAFGGRPLLYRAWPAILFLVFMLPLPNAVNGLIALPLQRIAATGSYYPPPALGLLGGPAGERPGPEHPLRHRARSTWRWPAAA